MKPNIVFILLRQRGVGRHRLLRWPGAHATHRCFSQSGIALQELQRRGPVRADALGAPHRPPAHSHRSNCSVPLPGQGHYGLAR